MATKKATFEPPHSDPLALFHPITRQWFRAALGAPTTPQRLGWPAIARGESTLILAPTGTGKTLTAFLWCLDRLMFHEPASEPAPNESQCRVVYISPLKALAVDVERNFRTPLESIAPLARDAGVPFRLPEIAIRTGDTPHSERARFRRHPADILITTPESLYLLLTSEAASALRTVDTVIVDEIHVLVPSKRGTHLALSLERLEAIVPRPLQRIGLSATQRPLEEVALFLGGMETKADRHKADCHPEHNLVCHPERSEGPRVSIGDECSDSTGTLNAERRTLNADSPPDPVVTNPRPVTIINASEPKRLQLKVEVPIEDFSTTSPLVLSIRVPHVPAVGDMGIRAQARLPFGTPNAERRTPAFTPREQAILEALARNGATFFADLHEAIGAGYPGETIDALWSLVWRGLVTNDTLHALRAYIAKPATARSSKREHNQPIFRSRRTTPPSAQGRWTLVPTPDRISPAAQTAWSHAIAQQLLHRYGIVTRETVAQENLPGGFSAVYEVLKALEAQGRIRRGYFIAGLGGAQFAQPAAVELLRSLSANPPAKSEMLLLAAADPANPWGSILHWPEPDSAAPDNAAVLTRSVGASVVLRNGNLVAYLRRGNPAIQILLPQDEPDRSAVARDLAVFLANYAQELLQNPETRHSGGLLISAIAGRPAHEHFLAPFLREAGFQPSPKGFHIRYVAPER